MSDGWSPIPGIDDAVFVSVSVGFACVVHQSGNVSCWGGNSFYQLGRGTKDFGSPQNVHGLPAAVAIATGSRHACALTREKTVWCWGSNGEKQSGGEGPEHIRVPTRISGIDDVAALSLSGYTSCARRTNGESWCWGEKERPTIAQSVSYGFRPVRVSADEVDAAWTGRQLP
ncbi:MAG: hypothetical protein K0V04_24395 [Deltaproteobacteria bacterium]|nr:hypothetical protein [Deltaproteobacteria bacterium]